MRLAKWMMAALLVPAIAGAQGTPVAPKMQAAFDRMAENVAQIGIPGEKERWDANVAAWKIVLSSPEQLSKEETDAINTQIKAMKVTLAEVKAPGERERWTANIELWQAYLKSGSSAKDLKAHLALMKKNVDKISVAGEKNRWEANYDLWSTLLPTAE